MRLTPGVNLVKHFWNKFTFFVSWAILSFYKHWLWVCTQ